MNKQMYKVSAQNRETHTAETYENVYDMCHLYGQGHEILRLLIWRGEDMWADRQYIDLNDCDVFITKQELT